MNVSVALCTYNGARFLEQQLDSLETQSRRPFELVICDDGSGDDTLAVAHRFANQASFRVRIFSNDGTVGPTRNFERAISICEGDLIALSDQDDVWHRDRLAKAVSVFNEDPEAGLTFSDAFVVDAQLRKLGHTLWSLVGFVGVGVGPFESAEQAVGFLLRRQVVTGATVTFRTRLRSAFLPIPESWVHDAWIGIMLAAKSRLVPIGGEPLIEYRQHGSNLIGARQMSATQRARESTQATWRTSLLAMHRRTADLQERLTTQGSQTPAQRRILELVNEAHRHFGLRSALQGSRLARIGPIARELVSGRYRQYSSGTLSAIQDLRFGP